MKIYVDKKTAQTLNPLQYIDTPTFNSYEDECCPWCSSGQETNDLSIQVCTECGKQFIHGLRDEDECPITIGLRTKGDVEYLKMMGKL